MVLKIVTKLIKKFDYKNVIIPSCNNKDTSKARFWLSLNELFRRLSLSEASEDGWHKTIFLYAVGQLGDTFC